MKLLISLTQEDINKAKRYSKYESPICLCFKRLFPEANVFCECTYEHWTVHIESKRTTLDVYLNEVVSQSLCLYEKSGQMNPLEFEIEI